MKLLTKRSVRDIIINNSDEGKSNRSFGRSENGNVRCEFPAVPIGEDHSRAVPAISGTFTFHDTELKVKNQGGTVRKHRTLDSFVAVKGFFDGNRCERYH